MNHTVPRALYNLLRLNWLHDPTLTVESWQVEDYRQLPLQTLFERLKTFDISLDRHSFIAHAETCESPEELAELITADTHINPNVEDQIYLLVFELWRRLLPEKPSLSIFCDELDHQIYLYDGENLNDLSLLQDALTNLQIILEENIDSGLDAKEAFQLISEHCANDIETFLYDFISEQIDDENDSYAQELLEGFYPYFSDPKWFDLLRIRLISSSNPKLANKKLSQLIEEYFDERNLEFNLELLTLLIELGDFSMFRQLVVKSIPFLKTEEDFQDLLSICAEYYHRLDQEAPEYQINSLLKSRSSYEPQSLFESQHPDINRLLKILDEHS